ncbi:MAG: phosphoribosylformylglycinamidine synthase subunit PurS [Bacteroidetes bacterium]|jgi:phosphoribosylformylglycinamidine synthase|nr:phosphoribosylformylglycinamidine synthase subunit PurS [Bacteroidota bacterium]
MFHARIFVTRRPSILEPEGRAIKQALATLDYDEVSTVRMGKLADLEIDVAERSEAVRIAEEVAGKLLANPVMEDFSVEVSPVETPTAA